MELLIISAAIDISDSNVPYTALTDTDIRLKQYLQSLEFAIENYEYIETIIFCDNTNYNYDYSDIVDKAHKKNKNLEVLKFQGDKEKVSVQGKGYGEGEIINYIFNNSIYIHNYDSFYKITGRLYVKNFNDIIKKSKGKSHFAFYPKEIYGTSDDIISTVFYKISKDLYTDKLLYAYKLVNDTEGNYLEKVFYKILQNHNIKSFKCFPNISGVSGSTGGAYDLSSTKMYIERIFNYLGVHDIKKNIWKQCIGKAVSVLRSNK